jgi:tetratricopeptide (TPR) repeat protein
MRVHTFLAALVAVATLGLCLNPSGASAEQIRLSDGRFLQGDVEEVRDDGFVFRLTDSGGKVFLRWNQVDAGLKQRLKNERDPDDGLNLEVTVDGARLELIDGTVLEGKITRNGNTYTVVNRDRPRGFEVPHEDVTEEGLIADIQIDASVMMSERDVLALAEERRAPLETARQYYEMARIADRLGLYEEAKDFVTLGLSASPDPKMQARLTEYEAKLTELIRQKDLLLALAAARQLAKQNKYNKALEVLKNAKDTYKPTDAVLSKWEEVNAEIDFDFTKFVINEWYKLMKPVIQAKLKDKNSKNITVQEALNWARREMDTDIQKRLAATTEGDAQNMKVRFMNRFKAADATTLSEVTKLPGAKPIRLTVRKVSFGPDGFYQIVGGHLPVAGKQPNPAASNPGAVPAPRGPGSGPGIGPGGGNPGNPGGGGDGPGGNNRNVGGIDWDELEDLLKDPRADRQFQEMPKLPDNISPDDIKEALRKALGEDNKNNQKKEEAKPNNAAKPDLTKLTVPSYVPSLTEWWERSGSTVRVRWLMAVYVKSAGTMQIVEHPDWEIKYR